MRVCHLITDAGPHPYFQILADHADRASFDLAVGCVGPPGDLQEAMQSAGVETFALGARSRREYPAAVAKLVSKLRRERTAVLQAHLVDACLVGLVAARLAGVPCAIHTAHHSHELPFHGRRLVRAEKLCADHLAHRVIAPSRSVAETLRRLAGVDRAKIDVIHHGFELDRLDPERVDGALVRRELGLEGATVIGAVGRSFKLKNYEALIEGFAGIAGRFPEARLLIVGPGDWSTARGVAARLGVGDRVLITGPRGDVPELLASLDVFVHPAIAESFGMVIIEAMAMARPVVATPVGIVPEVIEPGVNGILVGGFDGAALERALSEAFSRRAQWDDLGRAARLRAGEFAAPAMVAAYEAVYRRTLGLAE